MTDDSTQPHSNSKDEGAVLCTVQCVDRSTSTTGYRSVVQPVQYTVLYTTVLLSTVQYLLLLVLQLPPLAQN